MFYEGIRLPNVSAHAGGFAGRKSGAALVVATALLLCCGRIFAQHGGGGGRGMATTGSPGSNNRPTGVSTKDDLKDFHRLMAVQATAEQKTMFANLVQETQTASEQLKAFRELPPKVSTSSAFSDRAAGLEQAVEKARTDNKSFLASFSPTQKSGLKDATKKLQKADSDLGRQNQELSHVVQTTNPNEHTAGSAAELDKMLGVFQSEQLALGGEMSIILPSAGQDLTFTLPAATNSIDVAGHSIAIPITGTVSRASAEDIHNFGLKLTTDLSDLQREVSGILQSQLSRSPRCGERIEIQRATLTPLSNAGLVVAHLHFERWSCPPGQNSQSTMELAEGEGSIEIKLTPAVEATGGWHLVPEIGHVEGDGSLGELLASGDLGATLRDQTAASLLALLLKGTDLKRALPAAAAGSATIEKARFEDDGAGRLSLVLYGQLQFTDEQATQFVVRLKQRLSAQETSPP
jgi:hypothetical protein